MKRKFYLLFLTVLTIFIFPDKALGNGAFVEVTKDHGALTQENFKILQNHGIDGMVVQLAKGKKAIDAGVNPFAPQQVAGVRAACLKLAVSFVSTAQSPDEAIAEATELVAQIRSLNLAPDTPVVNVLSDPALVVDRIDPTPNVAAFRNQLLASGFTNVFQHCHADLLQRGWIRPDELGGGGTFWLEGDPSPYPDVAAVKLADSPFSGFSTLLSVNLDKRGIFTSSNTGREVVPASTFSIPQMQMVDPRTLHATLATAHASFNIITKMQNDALYQFSRVLGDTSAGNVAFSMNPSVTITATSDGAVSIAYSNPTQIVVSPPTMAQRLEEERIRQLREEMERKKLEDERIRQQREEAERQRLENERIEKQKEAERQAQIQREINEAEANRPKIVIPSRPSEPQLWEVHRMFNGRWHLFTTNANEARFGYHIEHRAFFAGGWHLQEVHRFRHSAYAHRFVVNTAEVGNWGGGWIHEGVGFNASIDGAEIYRLYNPHNYDFILTSNSGERDHLRAHGWHDWGVAFRVYRL
ncbi:MAG: hypothetical protein LBS28_00475 [Streptococcaceae bacterium]|jgi:hypothetical protein|nr:hypothetical protein [Streptococcaceae bacterium]